MIYEYEILIQDQEITSPFELFHVCCLIGSPSKFSKTLKHGKETLRRNTSIKPSKGISSDIFWREQTLSVLCWETIFAKRSVLRWDFYVSYSKEFDYQIAISISNYFKVKSEIDRPFLLKVFLIGWMPDLWCNISARVLPGKNFPI